MNINHIIVTTGPSVADPAGVIKLILIEEDATQHFIGGLGWQGLRGLWRVFLVWAIRRHVRKLVSNS